jgi:hypothetical protein
MYFNLKSLPDSTQDVRPKSFYLEKGATVLQIEAPMIIFCDETCLNDIRAIRGTRPTEYMVKAITEYDFYRDLHPIITHQRQGNPMYIENRNTPSYCILSLFKVYALYRSSLVNPFGTSYFLWVDFGGSHIMRNLSTRILDMISAPHPRVALCYIHYRSSEELRSGSPFHRGGMCGIAAGAITVEGAYAQRFYTGCMSIFYELLSKGAGHAEEQVITYFYDRYPEQCFLYYGDYYSIVSNYGGIREDFPSIRRFFLQEALNKGRKDLAIACAKDALSAVDRGILTLSTDDQQFLRTVLRSV